MKMTNTTGLSLPIAVWSLFDDYDYDDRKNVISATTLLKPTRMVALGIKFKDNKKSIDAGDLINVSMGTAIHDSVEVAWKNKAKVTSILSNLGYENAEEIYNKVTMEKRSEKQIGDWIVSGKFDICFDGIVADIKSTSVWTYIYNSNEEDYKKQMSIYRWLNQDLITNDYGYIEFVFTDWSAVKSKQDKQYPDSRVKTKKIKLMSIDETEKFIRDKLEEIDKNVLRNEIDIVKCSNEELWKSEDVFKYYSKVGAKRATKIYDTEKEAFEKVARYGGEYKKFSGEAKRCKYCSYTEICSQYQNEIKK